MCAGLKCACECVCVCIRLQCAHSPSCLVPRSWLLHGRVPTHTRPHHIRATFVQQPSWTTSGGPLGPNPTETRYIHPDDTMVFSVSVHAGSFSGTLSRSETPCDATLWCVACLCYEWYHSCTTEVVLWCIHSRILMSYHRVPSLSGTTLCSRESRRRAQAVHGALSRFTAPSPQSISSSNGVELQHTLTCIFASATLTSHIAPHRVSIADTLNLLGQVVTRPVDRPLLNVATDTATSSSSWYVMIPPLPLPLLGRLRPPSPPSPAPHPPHHHHHRRRHDTFDSHAKFIENCIHLSGQLRFE